MLGVFVARDLFLFYVMWEVMLVPMYFIIGIWGGARRLYASLKFFIYTFVGSLLMLVAILYLGSAAGGAAGFDFSYERCSIARAPTARRRCGSSAPSSSPFAVKVPMFPFHTWLPDAHVEAPTAGSVVLAGDHAQARDVRLPALRAAVLPDRRDHAVGAEHDPRLAVVGIIYGALVAMVPARLQEARRLLVGEPPRVRDARIFALTVESVQGALMVMINHGISTGALFCSSA
jgi:NADH-quinone oxidoreductase subunit M